MKKLMLSTAVVLGLAFSANAQETELPKTTQEQTEAVTTAEPEFKKIDKAMLPQAIKDAVMNDLEGMAVEEAFVTTNEEEAKIYKLIVTAAADAEIKKTVYADAEGNWIKPEDLTVGK